MKDYIEIKSRSPLVYWLNEEDVQNVAKDNLGRELTRDEIRKIIEPIGENIEWTEAIMRAIELCI